jgi:SRSO17 transposase
MADKDVIRSCREQFALLVEAIAECYSRRDLLLNAESYLKGLLSDAKRKNSWQLAESAGRDSPHAFQRLLGRARWDANHLRDALQRHLSTCLPDVENAVLVVDETGFLKKGERSAGVQRQYSGTAGRIENCQIGVFLGIAAGGNHCLIDRELYLPESWLNDRERSVRAGIPVERSFQTKPMLAKAMVQRAIDGPIAFTWLTGDEVYGNDGRFRLFLQENRVSYVLAVRRDVRVMLDGKYGKIDQMVGQIDDQSWQRVSCGQGTKGERLYDWIYLPIGLPLWNDYNRGVLVRRSISDPNECSYYLTFSQHQHPLETYVKVAGQRWTIEECSEQAKQETGLDEYEVLSFEGWQRHVTLSMAALMLLCITRSHVDPACSKKKTKVCSTVIVERS